MSQMLPADQAVVKALPGNNVCCDCGQKNPQWASVSFGNVFCLECSGIHRSLGTHISFVRSIVMDSWTDKQLSLMKKGGNQKFNDYLKSRGIDPRSPIKAKYESIHAQNYKAALEEGRPLPDPTSGPKTLPTFSYASFNTQTPIPTSFSSSAMKAAPANSSFGLNSRNTGTTSPPRARKISLDDEDFFASFGV